MHLVLNPKLHRLMKHVKHINLQFHMLREFSKQKEVALTYTFLSKWECCM
jgi:hypothetical protein